MNTIAIQLDGNAWCALIGDNLQEGVAGFGGTPREALQNLLKDPEFDNWSWNQ